MDIKSIQLTMKSINEIERSKYYNFYSMQRFIQSLAGNPKVWSWSAHDWTNDSDVFLKFKVNGHLFKGHIYIGVNGNDLFDIFMVDFEGGIVTEINDVFIQDLISAIDDKVEMVKQYKW